MSTTPPAAAAAEHPDPRPLGDSRLAPAHELVTTGAVRVLSLDVFDTVVFRLLPEPRDLFGLLGQRLEARGALVGGLTAGSFADLRRRAEERARQRRAEQAGGREVRLAEIWAQVPAAYRGMLSVGDLIDAELELERHLLRPDLDVLELIRCAHEHGVTVVAVSDTYLSATQLRSHVLALAPLEAALFDHVLASSDYRVSKTSGLFERVLGELAVRPDEVVHVGDSQSADIAPARALGMHAVHVEHRSPSLAEALSREWAYRRSWLHPAHGDHALAALRGKIAGSRELAGQPPELRPFWRWGSQHLGPVMTGFADWVTERAAAAGSARVLCLMREGDLLTGLIEQAALAAGRDLKAQPLWLSRQVCARALVLEGSREELARLVERRRAPLVGELVETLGLDGRAHPDLELHAQARLDDRGLLDHVLSLLTLDGELRGQIVAHAAVLRGRVLRSLEPLLPSGGEPLVLVDVGWAATIQAYLDRLLAAGDMEMATRGLYLLTHEGALERMMDGVWAEGFLATAGHPPLGVTAIARAPELLEQVCMPEFGSQLDIDERLGPVLGPAPDAPLQHAQRLALRQGIDAFQREWTRYRTATAAGLPDLSDGGQEALLAIIARALVAPTAEEAGLFEHWLHDENYGSQRVETISGGPLAHTLSHLDPVALATMPMGELYWPYGLAAKVDPELARAAELSELGLAAPDTFSSALDTGTFEVFGDLGAGFSEAVKSAMRPRRNRRGLSYGRGRVTGTGIAAVRVDPATMPCLLRLDWLSLRCSVRGRPEPLTLRLERPEELADLSLIGLTAVARGVFLATGNDPQIHIDLLQRELGIVYQVDVECGFATLPLGSVSPEGPQAARSLMRRRTSRLAARLEARARSDAWKHTSSGRLARRVARRLGRGRLRARWFSALGEGAPPPGD